MSEDIKLLHRIGRGESKALDLLMRKHYAALVGFAVRIVGSTQAAEDVVQDMFVRLWETRAATGGVKSVKSYLYAGVRNTALNSLRSEQRRRAHAGSAIVEDKDLFAYMVEQETVTLLLDAIARLPERNAQILRMTLEGERQDKIAEALGMTVNAVKLAKADGIRRMRKMIGPLVCLLM